jgi:hypothetical protein
MSYDLSRWMEVCLVEELPPTTELEEGLRNGVYLAKLAKFFAPKMVSEKKIYDVEQTRYKVTDPGAKHFWLPATCKHLLCLFLIPLRAYTSVRIWGGDILGL